MLESLRFLIAQFTFYYLAKYRTDYSNKVTKRLCLRPGGGIGRHEGLKIPCLLNGVRVQFPPRAQFVYW